MEVTELFYPQIAVLAGPYVFDQGVKIEVSSSKVSYFDWAKIRFTGQYQEKISLARKDAAQIMLGYNGVFDEVFTGYVAEPYNEGGFADEVTLKDEMLLLEETVVNNTFLDTTPQEMIAYFLAQGRRQDEAVRSGLPGAGAVSRPAAERHPGDQYRPRSLGHQKALLLLGRHLLLGRKAGAGEGLHLRVRRKHPRPFPDRGRVAARNGIRALR